MKKYYFIHLLILFIFGNPLAAQETDLQFQYLGGSRGLATSPVTCILQDRRGFMWFGTYEGLQRFDGYQCRTFRQRHDEQHTLSDNYITCIFADSSGVLWIGTQKGGLNRFDPKLEEFTHWVHSPDDPNSLSHNWVTEIIPAENGRLWLGTMGGGFNRLDPATGQFERWLHDAESENSLGGNLVRAIHRDREGLLWIATANSGLNRFDPETGIFTHWRHEPENPRSLGNNTIADIHQDFTGRLWFAVGNSLDLLDQSTGHFTHWQYNPKHESSEGDSTLITLFGNPNQEENHLWLGTFSGRLNLFAKQSGNVTRFEFDAGSGNGQRGNAVRTIYEDRNGTLWLGTLNGVYKATLHKKRYRIWQNNPEDSTSLSNDYTWSVHFGQDGAAYVGTMSGLNILDRQSGTFRRWQRDAQNPNGLSGKAVLSIYEDKSGMLWLGTFQGGLNRFDRKTGQFTHWRHDAADPYSLDNNAVFSILEDRRGVLWVGTMAGINRFDRQHNRFERIQPKPDSLASRRLQINAIYEDGSGAIWFGTYSSGLFRYDHESGDFENWSKSPDSPKSIGSNSISMICEDPEFGHHLIWFGTEGGGLNRLDVSTGEVRIISEKDGLPHNNVNCILTDSRKNLWISTDGGLARLNPKSFDLQKHEVRAGDEPFQFCEFGAAKSPDGELYFAGKNGLLAFYPENMQQHASPPPVVLTDFQVFNKSASPEPEGDSPLIHAISEADHIQLSHRQYVFSFAFAALDYTAPEENRYAYMMEGFHDDWIDLGNQRLAMFTNLDPGDYLFRVKAANSRGVWNEQGASIKVSIAPPFWRAGWFLALSATVVLSLLIGGYRIRTAQIRREKEAQEIFSRRLIEKQEEERKRIAGELHDSVGQGLLIIKNGLKFVQDALSKNDEKAIEELGEIKEVAQQAIDEIRHISYGLHPHQLEQMGLKKAIESTIKAIAATNALNIDSSIASVDGILAKDKEILLFRIVQESLNNIIKHAQASKSSVRLVKNDASLHIHIDDNGKGFAQKPATLLASNHKGLGLIGIAERVKILGGKLEINSTPGAGASLKIEIPLKMDAQ